MRKPCTKYPRWREMGIPKPNRSRRARGKQRLKYHHWYRPKKDA